MPESQGISVEMQPIQYIPEQGEVADVAKIKELIQAHRMQLEDAKVTLKQYEEVSEKLRYRIDLMTYTLLVLERIPITIPEIKEG